jgi:hypothetical protein
MQDTKQDILVYNKDGSYVTTFKYTTELQSRVLAKHLYEKGYNVNVVNNQTGQNIISILHK